MVTPIVQVHHASKSFGKQQVLRQVSLEVAKGSAVGIIGRNGSGKSVLLQCILGLLYPDSGEVRVAGKRIGKDVEFAPDAGFIINRPGFISSYSGFQNLWYLARLGHRVGREAVRATIARVGLDPNSKKHVGKYSTGMLQRLAIAQALMESPGLLLLDEPFNGLDEQGVQEMRSLLLAHKEAGGTLLLTTHNPEDLSVLCDAVYRMDGGKLGQETGKAIDRAPGAG